MKRLLVPIALSILILSGTAFANPPGSHQHRGCVFYAAAAVDYKKGDSVNGKRFANDAVAEWFKAGKDGPKKLFKSSPPNLRHLLGKWCKSRFPHDKVIQSTNYDYS